VGIPFSTSLLFLCCNKSVSEYISCGNKSVLSISVVQLNVTYMCMVESFVCISGGHSFRYNCVLLVEVYLKTHETAHINRKDFSQKTVCTKNSMQGAYSFTVFKLLQEIVIH